MRRAKRQRRWGIVIGDQLEEAAFAIFAAACQGKKRAKGAVKKGEL